MTTNQTTTHLFIHDIENSFSAIYASLKLIQHQHPEVLDFNYWKESMNDLEELREKLLSYPLAAEKENT